MALPTQALPPYLTASSFTVTTDGEVSVGVSTVVVSSVLPTQQLPPYLSASTFIATSDGVETTGVTTVGVPLTYFGPSIPLGTDGVWTFGGSTSPLPTPTESAIPSTLTTIPAASTSPTVIPAPVSSVVSGATSGLTSTTVNPSSLISTTIPSSASTVLSSSSSQSTSGLEPTPVGSIHKSNLHRALPGIIIASIIAAVILAMLACLFRYRHRRRSMAYTHPNLSDFVIVDAEGQTRVAGEGVARPTGEEEDSFLRSENPPETTQVARGQGRETVDPISRSTTGENPLPEGVVPTAITSTPKDQQTAMLATPKRGYSPSSSPFFHASASSLFFSPSRGTDMSLIPQSRSVKRDSGSTQLSSRPSVVQGNIIPKTQLLQMDDEWRQEPVESSTPIAGPSHQSATDQTEQDFETPLRPPPVLHPEGLSRTTSRPDSLDSQGSLVYPESPGSELDERATLLTARRVIMSGSRPETAIHAESSVGPSSWGSSLGLGRLTRLSRLSWFQRMEALRSQETSSQPPSRSVSPQPQMSVTDLTAPLPRRLSHLSAASNVSAGNVSGDSVYHDARSNISTPSGRRTTSPPPLPMRSVGAPVSIANTSADTSVPVLDDPPAQTELPRSRQASYEGGGGAEGAEGAEGNGGGGEMAGGNPADDALDTPVPLPETQFSTTSSRGGPALPPGLEHLANQRMWRESGSDMPTAASLGSGSGQDMGLTNLGRDSLEDAPPQPREGWSHLRSVRAGAVEPVRRTTLGQPIFIDYSDPSPQYSSEHGSLHSVPGRLSPLAPPSGSRPSSRYTLYNSSSNGSGSSRSWSNRSLGRSQLAHSNSITSDGRRRPRREPGEPLDSSMYGQARSRARLSALGGFQSGTPGGTPQRSPAADVTTFSASATGSIPHPTPAIGTGTGTIGSASVASTSVTGVSEYVYDSGASHNTSDATLMDAETGEVFRHPEIPWSNGFHLQ